MVEGLDLSQVELQQAEGNDVRWTESIEIAGEVRGDVLVATSP